MKVLAVILCTALMAILAQEAVVLHRRTICRQDAWGLSVTLQTRTLLSEHDMLERVPLTKCRIIVQRNQMTVAWFNLLTKKRHTVALTLQGKI